MMVIDDADACNDAADILGGRYVGVASYGSIPSGCVAELEDGDVRVWINEATPGKAKSNRRPICIMMSSSEEETTEGAESEIETTEGAESEGETSEIETTEGAESEEETTEGAESEDETTMPPEPTPVFGEAGTVCEGDMMLIEDADECSSAAGELGARFIKADSYGAIPKS